MLNLKIFFGLAVILSYTESDMIGTSSSVKLKSESLKRNSMKKYEADSYSDYINHLVYAFSFEV